MTVTPTLTRVVGENGIDGWQAQWVLTTANPQGVPVGSPLQGVGQAGLGFLAGYADKSVQVNGTFGGATVALQGGNDGVLGNFITLTNPLGTAASFTVAGLMAITEAVIQLAPVLTVVGAGATITVTVF